MDSNQLSMYSTLTFIYQIYLVMPAPPQFPDAVPITCSFEDMAPGKRARRLEFAIVIVGNVEGEAESDCYRKHSGGLSLLFHHRWGCPERGEKQLK